MKKILKLYEKMVYGRVLICCDNDQDQESIKALTGKKTLSLHDVDALQRLGVEIEWVKKTG